MKEQQRRSRLQRALHRAVKDNRLEDAKAFLRQGAVTTNKDDQGNTLLHIIAKGGSEKMATVELAIVLSENGFDLESQGDEEATPLIISAKYDQSRMLLFFIQQGARLEARDRFGRTALSYAAMCKEWSESCYELIRYGANPDSCDNLGYTPLHHAASGSENEYSVYTLLAANPSLTIRTKEGMSILDLALLSHHSQIAIACIKAGEIIQPFYEDDPCPLTSAAIKGDIKYVQYFLLRSHFKGSKYGYGDLKRNREQYALIEAAWMGHVEVVDDLLPSGPWGSISGVDLNVHYEGATLLHIALYRSDLKMLQKLLAHLEKHLKPLLR